MPVLECVVNVSEGRNLTLLDRFSSAIVAVDDCYLLHRDVGHGAHRTVFTFAGEPGAVFEAAYRVYALAAERIDMRKHQGAHPRLGAVDVCPFVAVERVSQEELLTGVERFARRVARKLGIPVYLYADSATTPARANLAEVRRGEYEGLDEKMQRPDWRPDYGPAAPHPTFGATVVGARPFLIAWNINLEPAATLAQAKQLAGRLRGSGSGGKAGMFTGLKAIGWRIEEYDRCQISCNVVDPDRVNLARIYLAAKMLARELGVRVTGSELSGLIPAVHLRAAAPDGQMDTAVELLGLHDLSPFDWRERVLEEVVAARRSSR